MVVHELSIVSEEDNTEQPCPERLTVLLKNFIRCTGPKLFLPSCRTAWFSKRIGPLCSSSEV